MKQEWFTIADLVAAKLPSMPADYKSIDKKLRGLRFSSPELVRTVSDKTKPVIEYHYTLLPEAARQKLVFINTELPPERDDRSRMIWQKYQALPDGHKAICRKRYEAICTVEDMRKSGIGATEAVAFICRKVGIGRATYYEWCEMVHSHARHDWLAALAPSFSTAADGIVSTIAPLHADAWQMMLADYLRPERPGFSACYRRVVKSAKAMKWGDIPSERSLRRKLDAEVPKAVQILKRVGKKAALRLFPAQQRSVAGLHAMEVVNTDGHQLDLFVRVPWSQTPVRIIMIGIQDVYSRKVLSWTLAESETWEAVRSCIGAMIENHDGALPYHIYMDNGRAFAGKMISGGAKSRHRFKILEDDCAGLLKTLDINAHFVKPYSGQSKPIERAWRDLAEEICKHPSMSGCYTGNKPDAKPENYSNSAVPLDVLQEHVAECIAEHNARTGRKTQMAKGRSFDEVFEASISAPSTILRYASKLQSALWMLAAAKMTARKPDGAIHMHGNRYWHRDLNQWIGKKLTVRFDPVDLHKPVKIYDSRGIWLCDAECIDQTGFMDTAAARQQEKKRKAHGKAIEALAKSTLEMEAAQLGEIAQRGRKAEQKAKKQPVRSVVTRLITRTQEAPEVINTIDADQYADNLARGLARVTGGDSAIIQFPQGERPAAIATGRKKRTEK